MAYGVGLSSYIAYQYFGNKHYLEQIRQNLEE